MTQRLPEASSSSRALARIAAAHASARTGRCGIFGREAELEEIEDFLGAIADGPDVLTVRGEPGMGRTTVWRYALNRARDLGLRVLAVKPTAEERDVLGLALAELSDGELRGPAADSATPAFDTGRQLLAVFRRLEAQSALLIAIDDLHYLDPVSASALRFALHRMVEGKIGVLVTVPTNVGECSVPLGMDYTRSVDLSPLPIEALRRALGRTVSTLARPELVRAHQESGGNPGRALTLVRSWRGDRRDDEMLGRVRLASLGPEALAVIRVLAAAGPSPAGVIAAVAGLADFPAAVAGTVAIGLIEVGDDLSMRFRDPISARIIAAATNPLDLCAVHRRLAEVVADPVRRAGHLALATVEPDAAVADELEVVAARAADSAEPGVAADLLGHAVRLTPHGDPDAAARRAQAEIEQRAAAGETAAAMELADRLIARLGRGPRRAQVLALRVFLDTGESRSFLRQALVDAGDDDRLRATILDLRGWLSGFYQGRLQEGLQESAEAMRLADRIGDRDVSVLARATLALTSSLAGRPCEALFREATEQAVTARLSPLGRWPTVFWGRHLLWRGQLAQVRRLFIRMQRDAVLRGSEYQRPYRLVDLAMVELAAGDLEAARHLAMDGVEAARDAGNEQAVAWLAHPLGLVAAMQGDVDTASWAADLLAGWAVANDEPPRQTMADEVLGTMAATSGQWDRALSHFASMVEQLDAMGYRHPGARPALSRAVEAAALVGDEHAVRDFTDRLAEQAAALRAPLVDALLLAARGQLAVVGDADGTAELSDAVRQLDELGYALEAARVRLPLARALLRRGQRSRARIVAAAAAAAFTRAKAPGWVSAAESLSTRAGAGTDDTLTGTELEVAVMVAGGRKNREIADALFVSVSTVEAHLTRVYRKLRLRSRTELTRWLAERNPSVA